MGLFSSIGVTKIPIVGGILGGLESTLGGEKTDVGPAYKPNEDPFKTTREQSSYLSHLQNKVYGPQAQAPSAAQSMLQMQTDANAKKMAGAIGSARGVTDPSLLAYQAARGTGDAQQQAVGQAAILRAQEEATGKQMQMAQEQMLGDQLGTQNAQERELERMKANIAVGQQALESQAAENARNRQSQMIGGLGSMGATIAAAPTTSVIGQAFTSDIKAKENISPANTKAKDYLDFQYRKMLNELTPYSYDYKNEKKNGSGPQLGVMAQDLEKSPLGKSMVGEGSDGLKQIEPNVSTILAGQASLNERLNQLEGRSPASQGNSNMNYLDYMGRRPASREYPGVDYVVDIGEPGKARFLDDLKVPVPNYVERPQSATMKVNKIPDFPSEGPSKIPSSPMEAPRKIPSAPMEPPRKFGMATEEMAPSEPQMASSRATSSSRFETPQEKMAYLDHLRKNYEFISNAFNKNYNKLG